MRLKVVFYALLLLLLGSSTVNGQTTGTYYYNFQQSDHISWILDQFDYNMSATQDCGDPTIECIWTGGSDAYAAGDVFQIEFLKSMSDYDLHSLDYNAFHSHFKATINSVENILFSFDFTTGIGLYKTYYNSGEQINDSHNDLILFIAYLFDYGNGTVKNIFEILASDNTTTYSVAPTQITITKTMTNYINQIVVDRQTGIMQSQTINSYFMNVSFSLQESSFDSNIHTNTNNLPIGLGSLWFSTPLLLFLTARIRNQVCS